MATPETWPRLTLKVPRHGATHAGGPAQPGGLRPNQHHMDRRTTEVSPAPWDTRGLCFRTVEGIGLWPTHRQPREDTAPQRLTGELVGHRRDGASERTTRSRGGAGPDLRVWLGHQPPRWGSQGLVRQGETRAPRGEQPPRGPRCPDWQSAWGPRNNCRGRERTEETRQGDLLRSRSRIMAPARHRPKSSVASAGGKPVHRFA